MAASFIPTPQSLLAVYNVRDYGAKGDDVTDDTAAIQAALNAAGASGVGSDCYCPPGNYLIAGSLNVPDFTTLSGCAGTWNSPNGAAGTHPGPEPTAGSTCFLVTGGAGNASGTPTISLNWMSTVRRLTMYWPNQLRTATTPTAYPWAITLGQVKKNGLVEDVCIMNAYQGIFVGGNERGIIRRVFGQPLSIGISCQGGGDVLRLEDCHWNPSWTVSGAAFTWQLANGIGFQFGRNDEIYCQGLFCYGYNYGYHFFNQTVPTGDGATGPTYGTFVGCNADWCNTSIRVDATNTHPGVNWIGGGAVGLQNYISMAGGDLSISDMRFWSTGAANVSHTGGSLRMSRCQFYDATAVSSSGSVFCFQDNLLDNAASTVTLSGTGKATVTGNTKVGGAFAVTGTMSGGTVNANNN